MNTPLPPTDPTKTKVLKYNKPEIILCIVVFIGGVIGMLLLGSRVLAAVPVLGNIVTILVASLHGVWIFALALVLAWFGLFTFPEVKKHLFGGKDFDTWWSSEASNQMKSIVSLIAVAVLFFGAIVALSH